LTLTAHATDLDSAVVEALIRNYKPQEPFTIQWSEDEISGRWYYGYYSNLCRGKRGKQNKDDAIPCIMEAHGSSKECRKNWARLIQKIYEIDPLTCPKCSGEMKVISVIEDKDVIKKILKHLNL